MSLSSKYGEARDTADTGETLYSGDTVSLSGKYRAGAEASASKSSIRRFVITEKAATTAFTFKTLLRHYAKWAK